MRHYKSRLIRLRSALKIRRHAFPFLKIAKQKKKHPSNLKTSGLPTNSPRERTTPTILVTKLLITRNIMFVR